MKEMFEIFGKIFFIAQQWQVLGDKEMTRIGLTTKQWMLLVVLENFPQGTLPSVTATAKAFGTSRQNVKRIAGDLEEKGYLDILKDEDDQRIQRFRLTGIHRPLFDSPENRKWQEEFITGLFEGFENEDLSNLQKGISLLFDNLHAIH